MRVSLFALILISFSFVRADSAIPSTKTAFEDVFACQSFELSADLLRDHGNLYPSYRPAGKASTEEPSQEVLCSDRNPYHQKNLPRTDQPIVIDDPRGLAYLPLWSIPWPNCLQCNNLKSGYLKLSLSSDGIQSAEVFTAAEGIVSLAGDGSRSLALLAGSKQPLQSILMLPGKRFQPFLKEYPEETYVIKASLMLPNRNLAFGTLSREHGTSELSIFGPSKRGSYDFSTPVARRRLAQPPLLFAQDGLGQIYVQAVTGPHTQIFDSNGSPTGVRGTGPLKRFNAIAVNREGILIRSHPLDGGNGFEVFDSEGKKIQDVSSSSHHLLTNSGLSTSRFYFLKVKKAGMEYTQPAFEFLKCELKS